MHVGKTDISSTIPNCRTFSFTACTKVA